MVGKPVPARATAGRCISWKNLQEAGSRSVPKIWLWGWGLSPYCDREPSRTLQTSFPKRPPVQVHNP